MIKLAISALFREASQMWNSDYIYENVLIFCHVHFQLEFIIQVGILEYVQLVALSGFLSLSLSLGALHLNSIPVFKWHKPPLTLEAKT